MERERQGDRRDRDKSLMYRAPVSRSDLGDYPTWSRGSSNSSTLETSSQNIPCCSSYPTSCSLTTSPPTPTTHRTLSSIS